MAPKIPTDRQVLNCWKLMGKQDLELNRWEMVKVDWVGECTIEFSKIVMGAQPVFEGDLTSKE